MVKAHYHGVILHVLNLEFCKFRGASSGSGPPLPSAPHMSLFFKTYSQSTQFNEQESFLTLMNIHNAMNIGISPQKEADTCYFFWQFDKWENHKVVVLLQMTVHAFRMAISITKVSWVIVLKNFSALRASVWSFSERIAK